LVPVANRSLLVTQDAVSVSVEEDEDAANDAAVRAQRL
jgi:hypothetical protein